MNVSLIKALVFWFTPEQKVCSSRWHLRRGKLGRSLCMSWCQHSGEDRLCHLDDLVLDGDNKNVKRLLWTTFPLSIFTAPTPVEPHSLTNLTMIAVITTFSPGEQNNLCPRRCSVCGGESGFLCAPPRFLSSVYSVHGVKCQRVWAPDTLTFDLWRGEGLI